MASKGPTKRRHSSRPSDPASLAALSICEALALALAEEGILPKEDVCNAIDDAIAAHRDAMLSASDPTLHRDAASLAERIRESIAAAAPPWSDLLPPPKDWT